MNSFLDAPNNFVKLGNFASYQKKIGNELKHVFLDNLKINIFHKKEKGLRIQGKGQERYVIQKIKHFYAFI